ncbi:bifunctional aldolase/short-chain dehydrogenase [Fulvivirga sedimenti]|uniref:Bifunctional aldolase/short-chain dehydrogenase n=1 Tax=Fulvivirga sedimenti TaxID=2879465 RepID=A0A9X1L2M1_9BACT|nr:bifunctional aldolase/short-chain dehydrogenase [Fulvivirga sedimenti]MCA6078346.1 bifunctional aldolase/short-chain dehydrogenase [Fulvivirga sedimenti]
MKSAWNDAVAKEFITDPLAMRVYTSRLLGQEEDLVLHGGGNTSVKITEKNLFGDDEEILYVKGSGWDLATIESQGFAPVKMDALLRLATLPVLTDGDMVKNQRMAMTNPAAPNPSVEAILHAIIPFTYVDHTHADAVVTLSNTPDGERLIREVYGDKVMIIPYVMPGFILARKIYEMTRDIDWNQLEGMILLHHGVFTFADDARVSYEKMIELVSRAEDYFSSIGISAGVEANPDPVDPRFLARIRKKVSETAGVAMLSNLDDSPLSAGFSKLEKIDQIINRGPLTPDHIIRTKRTPAVIHDDVDKDIDHYVDDYAQYFNRYASGETMLDPAPRWAVLPGMGTLSFGPSANHLKIIRDITTHTKKAIYQAEQLGGWTALPEKDLFEMEYWELEQAKLKKAGTAKKFQGKIAMVTGAASGIGKACVEVLIASGASVAALDIDSAIDGQFKSPSVLGIKCDITDAQAVSDAIEKTVRHFGGLDMIVSNAGIFPPSARIENMDEATWDRSIDINLSSHRRLLSMAIPYLKLGIEPSVVFIGSKNVPAPGPGASAYSVAKAGLAQLVRVAALELGDSGIRVNAVHPNAVYDTAIWTDEVLATRAKHYGLSVEEYKTNNILKKEVTSMDVAGLVMTMLGDTFSKITGAQVPIDGGNERVI